MAEPAVTIRAFHVTAGSNLPVVRVVIHTTSPPGMPGVTSSAAGQAVATAKYFTSAAAGGSAHYVTDVAAEVHCLEDAKIAWHAPPNEHSVGIEICGEPTYTRDQWLSPAVWPAVARGAARTAELCARYGIPTQRLSVDKLLAGHHGICGHVDVSQAWHQSDHTDPGPNFPWDRFMAAVTGDTVTPNVPPAPGKVWEYQEAEVRSTLRLIGPLDDKGRGYDEWNPGLGRDPIPVGFIKQGSDPEAGSADERAGDPYWEHQGHYDVKAQPHGGALLLEITGGVPGDTVGVYVSVA